MSSSVLTRTVKQVQQEGKDEDLMQLCIAQMRSKTVSIQTEADARKETCSTCNSCNIHIFKVSIQRRWSLCGMNKKC